MTAPNALSLPPDHRVPCPVCGPGRRNPANRIRPVRAEWLTSNGSVSWFCNRCEDKGVERSGGTAHQNRPAPDGSRDTVARTRQKKAQALWDKSIPLNGTPGETYLLSGRSLSGPFPPTLRYLPAYRQFPHAMIAAFAEATEEEPGKLQVPKSVCAVHLTELSPDGRLKLDKRMLGPVSGNPICLAPPNDGLGLILAEGIEDAFSAHEATGLGVWAAGSAIHLGKLANVVPVHVECVTVLQDDDYAGASACEKLSRGLLRRGFEVRVVSLGRYSRAA